MAWLAKNFALCTVLTPLISAFGLQRSQQDHRGVTRVTRPMLGFKSFAAAQATLIGIELMHMLKKGQLVGEEGVEGLTPAEQFYALAA